MQLGCRVAVPTSRKLDLLDRTRKNWPNILKALLSILLFVIIGLLVCLWTRFVYLFACLFPDSCRRRYSFIFISIYNGTPWNPIDTVDYCTIKNLKSLRLGQRFPARDPINYNSCRKSPL